MIPKPIWAVRQIKRSSGLIEDVCVHGIGHPNEESIKEMKGEGWGVHGCDGCCRIRCSVCVEYEKDAEIDYYTDYLHNGGDCAHFKAGFQVGMKKARADAVDGFLELLKKNIPCCGCGMCWNYNDFEEELRQKEKKGD